MGEALRGDNPTMTRRDMLRRGLAGGAAAICTGLFDPARAQGSATRRVLNLAPGVYLMLDDHLIAQQRNLKRTIHSPRRLPRPILTGKEDKCFQPYISVLRDPQTRRFRMWYN